MSKAIRFWNELEREIRRLRRKFPNSSGKAAARLASWCFRSFFKLRLAQNEFPLRSTEEARADGALNIFVVLLGGLGDVAMAATYLKELTLFSECDNCRFIVTSSYSRETLAGIFRGFPNVEILENVDGVEKKIENDRWKTKIDAYCELLRFPRLIDWNSQTFDFFSPRLSAYFRNVERFGEERASLFTSEATGDYLRVAFSLANGQNRRSQPDFDKTLGMSDATRSLATLDETAFDVLKNNGLDVRPYLTIQRGVGELFKGANNTRVWPKPYYERLIETIKTNFPELAIVLLGKKDSESDLIGVDVDLRGQTTFEELKILLKNSALHIDGECGMVHFAHALNSRCAVFFAQTNVDFCGYPENINVKVEGICPISCESLVADWQKRCPRGFAEPPCMTKLTPELFFDAIRPTLREIVERPKFEWERVDETTARTLANGDDGDDETSARTLFLGDFDRETFGEAERGGRVCWFSAVASAREIVEAREAGIDADWADATNVPAKDATFDRILCDVEEPSESVRREILRIAKIGGTARFGQSGGVWRKKLVSAPER